MQVVDSLSLLVTVILIPFGLRFWWKKEFRNGGEDSRFNQPVIPETGWVRLMSPLIWLWWLWILERRENHRK